MSVIKVSVGGAPSDADLSQYLGNAVGRLGDYEIHMNSDVETCDLWVVLDRPNKSSESCLVRDGGLIFANSEVLLPPNYYSDSRRMADFLDSFDRIFSCHDIYRKNVVASPPFLPWMVNANHGPSITQRHSRDVRMLESLEGLEKSRPLSVFCSSKVDHPHHKMRFRFVSALKEHFGDRLDWFGNGINPIPEKWTGLAPYKYSIALENHSSSNVITEKLLDCYITFTYPIYYGAPNVHEHLPGAPLTVIDIKDLNGSISRIEALLSDDPYDAELPQIRKTRDLVLGDFMFLNRIVGIAQRNRLVSPNANYSYRTVRSPITPGSRLRSKSQALARLPLKRVRRSISDRGTP